jgi:hypothetical protein
MELPSTLAVDHTTVVAMSTFLTSFIDPASTLQVGVCSPPL